MTVITTAGGLKGDCFMNKVILMGRLTKAPELTTTQTGKSVLNFSLAVDRPHSKDKASDFINCQAWEKSAEFICKWFSKGQLIAIDGYMTVDNYTDKNGNKRSATRVNVEHCYFTGDRGANNGNNGAAPQYQQGQQPPQQYQQYQQPQGQPAPANGGDFGDYSYSEDEDLPFN